MRDRIFLHHLLCSRIKAFFIVPYYTLFPTGFVFALRTESMALAFNAIIPHTRALSSSSSSVGFGSSSQKPSRPHFSTWVSHPRSRRLRNRISRGASASAGKTNALISDVEQHQLQGNDNGSTPASTSTTGKIFSNTAKNYYLLWLYFLTINILVAYGYGIFD